mmetsp:Transcript_11563/g.33252  ORF Transcript_11563/g.33252 Transcript_11563/m.33252 type:complete len:344 (+) Transcript_11563:3594-4625(+)
MIGNEETLVLGALLDHDPVIHETLHDQGAVVNVLVGAAGGVDANLWTTILHDAGISVVLGVTFEFAVGGRGGLDERAGGFFRRIEASGIDADVVVVVDGRVGGSVEDDAESEFGGVGILVITGRHVAIDCAIALEALDEVEVEREVCVVVVVGGIDDGVATVHVFDEGVGLLQSCGIRFVERRNAQSQVLAEAAGVLSKIVAELAVTQHERDLPVVSVVVHSADAEIDIECLQLFGDAVRDATLEFLWDVLQAEPARRVGCRHAGTLGLQRLDVIAEGERDDAVGRERGRHGTRRKVFIALQGCLDGDQDRDEADREDELEERPNQVTSTINQVTAHQGAKGT